MSGKTTPRDLIDLFEAELTRCAQERWRDPVAFGWRARRCTEAILVILLVRFANGNAADLKGQNLEALGNHELFKKGKGGVSLSDNFNAARRDTQTRVNPFAHFQPSPDPPEEIETNAARIAQNLQEMVPWVYESRAKIPPRVKIALDAIGDRRAALRPEREQALQSQLDEALERLRALARSDAATAPPATRRVTAIALAACLAGATGGFLAGSLPRARAPGEPSDPPAAIAPPPRVVAVEPAVPDAAADMQDVPAEPVARPCPPDAELFPAMRFRLAAVPVEDRPTWGPIARGRAVTNLDVGAFCLQRTPMSLQRVRALDPSLLEATRACRPASRGEDAPMGCILRAEAVSLCARWQPGGRLPTSLEWEAAVRAVAEERARPITPWQSARTDPESLEWVDEAFPAPWLARGAARRGAWMTRAPIPPSPRRGDHAWNSWNQHADERVAKLYVRCAVGR